MEAERRCLANDMEAVGEELQRQAVMLASAIGDALDAVDKNKGRRCLDLEAALANYETVFFRHERIADAGACASAKRARRILEDSWEEAMDKLEALAEVQAEELGDIEAKLQKESRGKVELGEFGVVEQLAEEDKLVEEFGIKEVEEPLSDKVEVEVAAARDDVLQGGGAIDPGEGDREIGAKVKVEVTCVGEVVTEIRVAQVKVERIDVFKVRAEEFANLEVLRDGQLDPDEVRGNWKEVQWLDVEVQQFGVDQELDESWHSVGLQRHDFLGHGIDFELQGPEMEMRFVSWVSGSLTMNSDFG